MAYFLDDQVFPINVGRGSIGGPDWPAEIITLASGREERNTAWSAPLRLYDAKYGVRTHDELYDVLSLYYVALGKVYGFRFQDWSDYRSGRPQQAPRFDDQVLGTGDGVQLQFQLAKVYARGPHNFTRTITKPFGAMLIGAAGVAIAAGFTVDLATGIVSFAIAPALGVALTWGGQFHVPVRFDSKIDLASQTAAIGDIPSIFLKELRA